MVTYGNSILQRADAFWIEFNQMEEFVKGILRRDGGLKGEGAKFRRQVFGLWRRLDSVLRIGLPIMGCEW